MTCAKALPPPESFDQNRRNRIGVRAAIGAKSALGESSSTTPVKCFETSSSHSSRLPKAGS
jgi:hypothetical protein